MKKRFGLGSDRSTYCKGGYLLLNVILMFLLISIIILSITYATFANQKAGKVSSNRSALYYYAESGILEFNDRLNKYIGKIIAEGKEEAFRQQDDRALIQELEEAIVDKIDSESIIMNQDVKRQIRLEFEEDELVVLSKADSLTEGRSLKQRVLDIRELTNNIETGMCINKVITARSQLNLNGKANINGDLFLMNPKEDSLYFAGMGNNSTLGNLTLGPLPYDMNIEAIYKGPSYLSWDEFLINNFLNQEQSDKERPYVEFSQKSMFPEVKIEEIKGSITPLLSKNHTDYFSSELGQYHQSISITYQDNISFDLPRNRQVLDLSNRKNMNNAVSIKMLKVPEGAELILDLGDKDIDLVIDDFSVSGSIIVKGSGNLRLYSLEGSHFNLNPYTFVHIGDKQSEDALENGEFFKEKISIVFRNSKENAEDINLRINHVGSYNSFTLVAENHNLSIAQGARYSLNVLLLGENNQFISPPTGIDDNRDYETNWDLIYVPKGTIQYHSQDFYGVLIADTVDINNTAGEISYMNPYSKDHNLPHELSYFNANQCNDTESGQSNNLILGPIQEVAH